MGISRPIWVGSHNILLLSPSQKAPDTGELVIMGIAPTKPYMEIGIISGQFWFHYDVLPQTISLFLLTKLLFLFI